MKFDSIIQRMWLFRQFVIIGVSRVSLDSLLLQWNAEGFDYDVSLFTAYDFDMDISGWLES